VVGGWALNQKEEPCGKGRKSHEPVFSLVAGSIGTSVLYSSTTSGLKAETRRTTRSCDETMHCIGAKITTCSKKGWDVDHFFRGTLLETTWEIRIIDAGGETGKTDTPL